MFFTIVLIIINLIGLWFSLKLFKNYQKLGATYAELNNKAGVQWAKFNVKFSLVFVVVNLAAFTYNFIYLLNH